LPVPALTAEQTIADALRVQAGQTVLVNGAGGVTGGMLVQLAAYRGATVIATAGGGSAGRGTANGGPTRAGAPPGDRPGAGVGVLTNGGAEGAANAVPSGSAEAVKAVRDGGRLATITADLPPAERDIAMAAVLVAPDGGRLRSLVRLLDQGALTVSVGEWLPL